MTAKTEHGEDSPMSEITVVEFESSTFGNSYVSELSDGPPYTVHGIALGAGDVTVGASGIKKKWPAEELQNAAESLRGTNLVVDHNNDATGVVGRVTKSGYKEGTGVVYEAELYEEDLAEKVKNGLLEVSIRGYHADVDSLEEDEETGAKVVEDIQFDNLSIVPTGAAPSNTLEMGAHAELLAAELSTFTDSLEAAELAEIEPGMWVQWGENRGITISQIQDGEIEVDIYEERDGQWRSTEETEMVSTDDLSEWDVDEDDIGPAEGDGSEEDESNDEEENAELVSTDDKVTWESSGGSAQGIVRERKTDGCFNEEIDGDQEICASEDEAVVLIEIVKDGEGTGTMVAHKEGTLNDADFEMAKRYDDYPEAASENAQMALDAREETDNPNDCGTDVGWKRAKQLANGEGLTREQVGKMSAFNRHRSNSDQSEEEGREDCGWMMWKAWGGDEGVDWAQSKLDSIEEENESRERGAWVKFKDVNNNWKYGQIIGMNQDGAQTVATVRLFTESGDKLDETVEKPVQGLDPWDTSPDGEMPQDDAQRPSNDSSSDAIDAPEWSDGQMVAWQVNPDMMGKIVHVDEAKQIVMVEVMEEEGGELVSSGFTVTAGYSDLEPVDEEAMSVSTKNTPVQDADPSHEPMGEPENILDLFKKFMSEIEGTESSLKDFSTWAVETEELYKVERGESEEKKNNSEQDLKNSREKDPKWLDSEIEELALEDVNKDHRFNSREEAEDMADELGLEGVHKMGSVWVPGNTHEEYMDAVASTSKHSSNEDEDMDEDMNDDEEEMASMDDHRHTIGVVEAFLDDTGEKDMTIEEFLAWIDDDTVAERSVKEFIEEEDDASEETEVSVLQTWLNDVVSDTDEEDVDEEEASVDEGDESSDAEEELQDYEMNTPEWSGTTESDWSSPDMEDFDTDDLEVIADHFLISSSGFPPENFSDLKLPVVEPNGDLNVNALEAVKGGRGVSAVDGLSDEMEEDIVNWVNNVAEDEFDRDWGEEEEASAQSQSVDEHGGRPTPGENTVGGVRVLSGDDLQQRSKSGESDADSLTTLNVINMTEDIEEKLAELKNPVAVEKDEVSELRDKANRFEEMSENLEALRERTDILDEVDRSQVEELAESEDPVVKESARYEELQSEAEQVKGVYAASLAEEYPAFTAEELTGKFGIEELREKFEEQIGDVEEELTSSESAEPRSQDADEESLEEASESDSDEEELSDEVAEKQEQIRDKILGGN